MTLSRLFTATLLVLCVTLTATAQSHSPDTYQDAEPEIPTTTMEFDDYGTYDFGEVEEGEIVTHTFTFTNTGTEPLILTDAKGSCGCTVPSRPNYPVAPGETASITVQFNSTNKKGKRNQKVTITANTEPRQTFIYLTGTVRVDEDFEMTVTDVIDVDTKAEPTAPKECFTVFPNPTSEVLKLRTTEEDIDRSAEIVIRSQDGQLMARRVVERIVGDMEFDVSHYPKGTYFAQVSVSGRQPQAQCFLVQ